MEVVVKNRSDSNPVQDEVATEPNNSFAVELSRLPPPLEKATFTISSPPPVQFAEDEQSEFPEGIQYVNRRPFLFNNFALNSQCV